MIRVLVVDDHPAIRAGLTAAIRSEPGFVPAGTASGVAAAIDEQRRSSANAALVDHQLEDGNGLVLCHRLKCLPAAPAIVIYSAFARRELAVAATVAGADGVVDKTAPLNRIFESLRLAVRGERASPAPPPSVVQSVASRLQPEDLPILGMRLDGTTLDEIASVLRLEASELSLRVRNMLDKLCSFDVLP